jgi:acyl-CoA synthetase (AMP-forming)/AMP-acid ligase II
MVQFSSGTVVDPKPVALTHANLFANVSAMRTTASSRPGLTSARTV